MPKSRVELTADEAKHLRRLEEAVALAIREENACATVQVATQRAMGIALKEIRERRYYRATHEKFEDYCREKWGFSRIRAHQLIKLTLTTVNTDNERQARELIGYAPEVQARAWETASAGGRPTAPKLRDALEEMEAEEQAEVIRAQEEKALAGSPARESDREKFARYFATGAKRTRQALTAFRAAEAVGEVPAEILTGLEMALQAMEDVGGEKKKRAA